jgi:hypothetical protein
MNHSYPAHPVSKSGFALISVLALVSLAALTATAFLASARLERQATRPIGETTRLQMTLNTGRECASEVINRIGEPYWNFVTTYWRTNSADELGYLFVGKPYGASSLRWDYYCGFTPAQWTNLDSTNMTTRIRATNTNCQATYSNDMVSFMASATSGFSASPGLTNPKCVQIPLLGGRTSPTVGWVYIKQDIRTNLSSTNTSNLPVARFAYFTEDLGGLIDADRMCGTNTRNTGTNAEEISLTNLAGSPASNIAIATLTDKRPQYLTPGMLLTANGGVLTNTNDLRYFASRLRYCNWNGVNTNWDRIPMVPICSTPTNGSYYPTNAGYRKLVLTNLNIGGQSIIAASITNSFPMFTNRAGGMNSTNYINALAANIVDYADTDSAATSTSINGVNIVGFDNYPMLTHVFDRFLYDKTAQSITITTYLQFWNPSSIPTRALNGGTFTYSLKDTVFYPTNTAGTQFTNRPLTNSVLANSSFTFGTAPFSFPANSGYITSITNTVNLNNVNNFPGFTNTTPNAVKLNTITGTTDDTSLSNSFTVTGLGVTNRPLTSLKHGNINLPDGTAKWLGTLPGLRYESPTTGKGNFSRLCGDPRMLNYLTNSAATRMAEVDYANVFWEGYPYERVIDPTTGKTNHYGAFPGNWPDGTNTANNPFPTFGKQYADADTRTPGSFTITEPGPCKISNFGSYTNICELGNIFDPIQWAPPTPPTTTNYANVNITNGTTWTANSLYGGGSTLRIGRPEHSRFAFTNLGGTYPVPSLGTSAAGLLDIFCTTNVYNWAGKININTAPAPVLAALAGGIKLDTNNYSTNGGGNSPVNRDMVRTFTNGVVKFRQTYPFITPSQLAFMSSDYGTTWTNTWPSNAVFSTDAEGGLNGPTAINDQGREEWFSKIYNLTCVQSFNYRIYVVAQLTDTNGKPKGAMMRKYYQLHLRYNQPTANTNPPANSANRDLDSPSVSPVVTYEAFY